jgi:iron(III) transport system ATP-binding protein
VTVDNPRKTGVDVVVDGVNLAYGTNVVLRDISLAIAPGEFFALLGPSGSGKSTLLRLLAGFNRANGGQVRIGGVDVAPLPPWKRDVGMVFQNYALWPHLTVFENVAFGLEERRWPRARVAERVREVLDLVSLAGFDARRPGELSGGQQQRVAIARTLAIEPSVLLLDEPLSNLDAKLRAATGLELKRLQRRLGITTLFVTHDQQEAMTIADRLAVLDQGVIQQVGTPRELYDAPVNRFVAEFVGSINLYPARILTGADATRGVVVAIDGLGRARLPATRIDGAAATAAAAGRAVAAAFRPHAVRVAESGADDDLAFDAEVRTTEFLGEFVRHELAAGAHTVVADLPHRRFSEALAPGARARFAVSPAEIFVLDDPPR